MAGRDPEHPNQGQELDEGQDVELPFGDNPVQDDGADDVGPNG